MPPNRGTTLSTEQRQLRPREEKDALGQWLDALFNATADVLVFSLPVLTIVMLTGDIELSFATIVALAVFVLGVGVQRHRPLGPPWPRVTPLLALVRLLFYNTALVAGLALGRTMFSEPVVDFAWVLEPILAPSLVASAVVLVAVMLFPYLAVALGQVRHS